MDAARFVIPLLADGLSDIAQSMALSVQRNGYTHLSSLTLCVGGGPHRSDSYGARLSYKSDSCQGNHSPSN